MTYAVQTKDLRKQYKTTLAVDNINLNIPEGVCCGFLGKNGAGKTTTIRMLVGLLPPTAGSMSIMGEERCYGKQGTPSFGYLPDVPNFYGYMTGGEFLQLCAKLCNIAEPERSKRVKELLEIVGLGKARSRISGYSRGMKQRLGIAQALINKPPVIFMDEPISALDPIGRRDVADIIRSLKGTTIVLSTHILADVEDICDYALIIEKGKILEQDYLANLKEKYAVGSAKVRLYSVEDAEILIAAAKQVSISFEKNEIRPQEVLLKSEDGDVKELTRKITGLLHTNNIICEFFGAHTPTLEDIFYKAIAV